MDRESFRALAIDVKPIIEELESVLEMHGVEKSAWLTCGTNGYVDFSVAECNYQLVRCVSSNKLGIKDNAIEVIENV